MVSVNVRDVDVSFRRDEAVVPRQKCGVYMDATPEVHSFWISQLLDGGQPKDGFAAR